VLGVGAAELADLLAVLEDDERGRVGDAVALGNGRVFDGADPGERDPVGPRELAGELVVYRRDGLAGRVALVVDW
jgi:hypothetical protein